MALPQVPIELYQLPAFEHKLSTHQGYARSSPRDLHREGVNKSGSTVDSKEQTSNPLVNCLVILLCVFYIVMNL